MLHGSFVQNATCFVVRKMQAVYLAMTDCILKWLGANCQEVSFSEE